MQHGGKIAILLMVLLAVSLSGLAVWHQYREGRRTLALWGTPAAQRIRHADHVELARLAPNVPGAEPGESFAVDDVEPVAVLRWHDISNVPGLVHARHVLIVDRSFQWHTDPATGPTSWSHAMRFSDDRGTSVLLFDADSGRVRLVDPPRDAVLGDVLVGLRDFWERHLDDHPPD